MKWQGYRQVSVKSLRLPGDIGARQKWPHVIDLAADIRELGDEPIHAPTFSADGDIICGRDRMAALLVNRTKRCWIRVADADEQERADLEASENLHRRQDNRDELIARRVHRIVAKIAAKEGRIASRRGEAVARRDVASARKRVAAQLGTTSKAIKSAEERAGRANGGGDNPGSVSPGAQNGTGGAGQQPPSSPDLRGDPGHPLETFGIEVTHEFCDEVGITKDALRKADLLLQQAQAALKVLTTQNFPGAVYQDLKAAIHAAGANVRLAVPSMVCVYCRDVLGTQGRRANCNGCGKHGYLLLSQRDAVPKELLAKGAKPVTGLSRSAAKRVSILDEDGQPIEIEPFDEPAEDAT